MEDLINKVNKNNWQRREDNISLIKKLLNNWKFYASIDQSAEVEMDENDRRLKEIYEKSIVFLKDNIENLIKFIKSENKYYEIFPIIQAEKSAEFLFKKFLLEENQDIIKKIRDVLISSVEEDGDSILWFEPFLPGLAPFLEEISHKIVDRNSKYFWEVVKYISNKNIEIKTNLYQNRRKILCGIRTAYECVEFIPLEKNKYFIAYPFSNKKIKEVITDSFKKRWQRIYGNENKLTPITADQKLESKDMLCNICKKIYYTKFGVYVLSKQRKTNFSNPNVMLELGIAMKIGKPYILIYKKGTRSIVDLAGHIRFEYNTYNELKEKIMSMEKLENHLQVEV